MLSVNGLKVSLDKRERGSDIDFISHAHSDHTSAAKSSKHVLASDQTVQLMKQVYNLDIGSVTENTDMRLLESATCWAPRQLCMDLADTNERVVYTGDFQMQKSKTTKPIEVVEADCVIMTSVYPDPGVVFQDKYEVGAQMQDWTGEKLKHGIVLFSAYAMGKSQELIALLNDAGIKPLVSRKIHGVNGVYQKNGVELDYAPAFGADGDFKEMMNGDFVGITERRDVDVLAHELSVAHNKTVFTAVATGFANVFRFRTDAQFGLSDHADFSQSVDYIEAAKAKRVFAYGSNCERFVQNLCKKGYDAHDFSEYVKMGVTP